MFLPSHCPLCGRLGQAPCPGCAAGLDRVNAVPPVAGCASVSACFRYDSAARALLVALKFRNRRDAVGFLADALAVGAPAVDLVTWAPTTRRRVRARGFDQAEVLARAVGRRLGVPVRPTLGRVGLAQQTGSDAAARRVGPVFVPRGRSVAGASVLVIDDVITTGSTFAHAAAVLSRRGARAIHARAVAWTPPGRHKFPPLAPAARRHPVAS